MGDRALVVFTDGREVSPTVYLHWDGREVPAWLEEHKRLMASRGADVRYAAARFIGLSHSNIPGNLSLGCWNNDDRFCAAVRERDSEVARAVLENASHGDAGVIVVDVRSYTWKAYGGYLESDHSDFAEAVEEHRLAGVECDREHNREDLTGLAEIQQRIAEEKEKHSPLPLPEECHNCGQELRKDHEQGKLQEDSRLIACRGCGARDCD